MHWGTSTIFMTFDIAYVNFSLDYPKKLSLQEEVGLVHWGASIIFMTFNIT